MVWWWDRTRRKEKFVETHFFLLSAAFLFLFPSVPIFCNFGSLYRR
ncbi:hypothetical protein LINGRAHAP2_LOCUS5157 [Linum grandiflorum]